MSEIQFIVDKLNEPPFSKDLRLVRWANEHSVLCFVLGYDIIVTRIHRPHTEGRKELSEFPPAQAVLV